MKYIRNFWTEIVVGICCIICFVSLKYYYDQFGSNGLSGSTSNWGTFGDYVGGVLGTILSFFSVILIYATYKNQVANSTLQQFETTVFNLLTNQREILKSLNGDFPIDALHMNFEQKSADEYISAVASQIYDRFDTKGINVVYEDEDGKEIPNFSEKREESERIIDFST